AARQCGTRPAPPGPGAAGQLRPDGRGLSVVRCDEEGAEEGVSEFASASQWYQTGARTSVACKHAAIHAVLREGPRADAARGPFARAAGASSSCKINWQHGEGRKARAPALPF